jgi:hypothetical protein
VLSIPIARRQGRRRSAGMRRSSRAEENIAMTE